VRTPSVARITEFAARPRDDPADDDDRVAGHPARADGFGAVGPVTGAGAPARGREDLCPESHYTGWDTDGGYAEFAVAPAAYALPLPGGYSDDELAPLLCAGLIGYHALARAEVPEGGRLGIYGFGGSTHLTAQVAIARGATVPVLTRSAEARELALELGAASAGDTAEPPPEPLDSAILFAPAGELVLPALEALDRGGTPAVAGIHLSDVPPLDYQQHLVQQRQVRSVTANPGATRASSWPSPEPTT
jgi:propanol-preferring alcohol dehydrogenase